MPEFMPGTVAVITGGVSASPTRHSPPHRLAFTPPAPPQASGFGLHMGQQLQAMGMHVAVLDVEAAALDAGVASLRASAPPDTSVKGYLCDVSSLSAVEAAAAGIAADFDSPIGFVGANAGTQRLLVSNLSTRSELRVRPQGSGRVASSRQPRTTGWATPPPPPPPLARGSHRIGGRRTGCSG